MNNYQARRERIYEWMAQEGIGMVMFEDFEGRRSPSPRWITGQPGDSLLFLSVNKQALLIPWDINMAMIYADADILYPYAGFDRRLFKALRGAVEMLKIPQGSRIEIPRNTSYPNFLKTVEEFSDFDILCREDGAESEIEKFRAVKDQEEIGIYRQLAAFTNEVMDLLEKQIRDGRLKTEADVALFIDTEGRKKGCEGMGFETLAAGPDRSFGIHAFPSYTGKKFAENGLSILDFGLKYSGYTTDVTMTFVRPPLSRGQEKLLSLTEKAYNLALSLAQKGAAAKGIAAEVDAFFGKSKKAMPHSLGHGIGLEAHEAPALRNQSDNQWILEEGMIFTLEPGLYDPVHGGCRLENDILITEGGAEVLTTSRIVRL